MIMTKMLNKSTQAHRKRSRLMPLKLLIKINKEFNFSGSLGNCVYEFYSKSLSKYPVITQYDISIMTYFNG